jgi:hypothetical protein
MTRGIQHREIQTCGRCGQPFVWAPGRGMCPYCDLTREQRQGPYERGEPCVDECCAGALSLRKWSDHVYAFYRDDGGALGPRLEYVADSRETVALQAIGHHPDKSPEEAA